MAGRETEERGMPETKIEIEVANAGDRERVHPRFKRRIVEICLDSTDWIKIGGDDVSVSFIGSGTARPGPVNVSVRLAESLPRPTSEASALLASAISTRVHGFYFDNGYRQRDVRTEVLIMNPDGKPPTLVAVRSTP